MSQDIVANISVQRKGFSLSVDLRIPAQGVSAVYGPSGCGKTTFLRCLAGLSEGVSGHLSVAGEVWLDTTGSRSIAYPTHKRAIGYVFQEASLFPHLSALGNLQYALKRAPQRPPAIEFDQAVSLLGLSQLLDRLPAQLSGGERQRVAIARALLINPQLLLMDEPLSSLDLRRKQEILPYLEGLFEALKIPVIYVSHSPDEVARLAHHLIALDNGKVVADGPLVECLSNIDLPIILGGDTGVIIDAKIDRVDSSWQLSYAQFSGVGVWLTSKTGEMHQRGDRVRLRILARDVSLALSRHDDTSISNILPATVEQLGEVNAGSVLVKLRIEGTALLARVTERSLHHLALTVGSKVYAQIKSLALV